MQSDRFNNRKYGNWVKNSLSLLYLKEGIANFSNEKAGEFHQKVTELVRLKSTKAATTNCANCTYKSAKKAGKKKDTTWRMNCSSHVCSVWLEEILPYHSHLPLPNIAWANSNPQLWPSDVWEIAKLFQPYGCKTHSKAEDSDCTALLTLMLDCTYFHKFLTNTARLREIKDVRNACMHSRDQEIDDQDMTNALDLMLALLEEPFLKNRPECIAAKTKIVELRDNALELSLNKDLEIRALNNRLAEVRIDFERLDAEHQQTKADLNNIADRQDSTLDEYKNRMSDVKQKIAEMTENWKSIHQTHDPSLGVKVDDLTSKLQDLQKKTHADYEDLFENVHATMGKIETRLHDMETQKAEEKPQKEDIFQRGAVSKMSSGQRREMDEVGDGSAPSQIDSLLSWDIETEFSNFNNGLTVHPWDSLTKKIWEAPDDEEFQMLLFVSRKHLGAECHTILHQKNPRMAFFLALEKNYPDREALIEVLVNIFSHTNLHAQSGGVKIADKIREYQRIEQQDRERKHKYHDCITNTPVAEASRPKPIPIIPKHDQYVKDIQKHLTYLYKENCQRIPIFPLIPSRTSRVDKVYTKLNMTFEDPHGKAYHDPATRKKDVNNVAEIFHKDGEPCRNIYISGEMGSGKTTFCEHLVNLWVRSQTATGELSDDVSFMGKFTFLFYISLSEANKNFKECYRVQDMIASQLDLRDCNVEQLLTDYDCLIIYDGLDELNQKRDARSHRFASLNLPERPLSEKCVYLTTSRPFQLAALARDLENKIDRQIAIEKLDSITQKELVNKVLTLLNSERDTAKTADSFIHDMATPELKELLETPLLLVLILGLWYDEIPIGKSEIPIGKSKCAIYCQFVEQQLKYAEQRIPGLHKEEQTRHGDICIYELPPCFSKKTLCQKFKNSLCKASKIAYEYLICGKDEYSSVVSQDETTLLLKMGILTQHKVSGGITEEPRSVSFPHKSFLEFYCALYFSTKDADSDVSKLANIIKRSSDNMFYLRLEQHHSMSLLFEFLSYLIVNGEEAVPLQQTLLFLCGLNAKRGLEMLDDLMENDSLSDDIRRYRQSLGPMKDQDVDRIEIVKLEILSGTTNEEFVDERFEEHRYDTDREKGIKKLLRTWEIVVKGTKEARENGNSDATANIRDIYIKSSIHLDQKFACKTTKVRSICIECTYLEWSATFVNNFSSTNLLVLHIYQVSMTDEQLKCLFENLSKTEQLRKIYIEELKCFADHPCNIDIDFSGHTQIEKIYLKGLLLVNRQAVCVKSLRLNEDMKTLQKVELERFNMSASALRELVTTLPWNGVKVYIGNVDQQGRYDVRHTLIVFEEEGDIKNNVEKILLESPKINVEENKRKYYDNKCELLSLRLATKEKD